MRSSERVEGPGRAGREGSGDRRGGGSLLLVLLLLLVLVSVEVLVFDLA